MDDGQNKTCTYALAGWCAGLRGGMTPVKSLTQSLRGAVLVVSDNDTGGDSCVRA